MFHKPSSFKRMSSGDVTETVGYRPLFSPRRLITKSKSVYVRVPECGNVETRQTLGRPDYFQARAALIR